MHMQLHESGQQSQYDSQRVRKQQYDYRSIQRFRRQSLLELSWTVFSIILIMTGLMLMIMPEDDDGLREALPIQAGLRSYCKTTNDNNSQCVFPNMKISIVSGESMWPTLSAEKASMVLYNESDKKLVQDELYIYVDSKGRNVLHRCVKLEEDKCEFRGDNPMTNPQADPTIVNENMIVGRVMYSISPV